MSELIELEKRIASRIIDLARWFGNYPEVQIVLRSLTTTDGLTTANLDPQRIRRDYESCLEKMMNESTIGVTND